MYVLLGKGLKIFRINESRCSCNSFYHWEKKNVLARFQTRFGSTCLVRNSLAWQMYICAVACSEKVVQYWGLQPSSQVFTLVELDAQWETETTRRKPRGRILYYNIKLVLKLQSSLICVCMCATHRLCATKTISQNSRLQIPFDNKTEIHFLAYFSNSS